MAVVAATTRAAVERREKTLLVIRMSCSEALLFLLLFCFCSFVRCSFCLVGFVNCERNELMYDEFDAAKSLNPTRRITDNPSTGITKEQFGRMEVMLISYVWSRAPFHRAVIGS